MTRLPPVPALFAAPLAVLSAFAPGLFFLIAIGFSGGRLSALEWLLLALPLALSVGLLVGAVLLGLGRSWRVVTVSAAALGALIVVGTLFGGWAEDAVGFALVYGVIPLVAAVLASRPVVRRWVEARRASR